MEKRHAYLILAHKNFGQLRKLVELLDDPRNDIFIHVDGRADFDPAGWDKVCGYSALKFLKHRYMVHWGGVSIMRSELALLKEAASHGHYAYYHLLSGMDLPIKDQDTVHAFFERNSGSEFLNLWRMRKNNYWRFNYWAPFPEGGGVPMLNFLNNVCKAMQKVVGYRKNRGITFKKASQWFSITDDLARYVISKESWLEKVFSHTTTCDEIFLATLVWNSPFRAHLYDPEEAAGTEVVNESNMRFIDWTRTRDSHRHPWVFGIGDWDLLMRVPHMWARKFDEKVDGAIIDRIYEELRPR